MVNKGVVANLIGADIEGRKIGGKSPSEVAKTLGSAEQKFYREASSYPLSWKRNFAFGSYSSGGGGRDLPLSSRGLPESYVGDFEGKPIQSLASGGGSSGGGGRDLPLSSRGLPESYVGDFEGKPIQSLASGGGSQDISQIQKFEASKDFGTQFQPLITDRTGRFGGDSFQGGLGEIYDPRTGMFISQSPTGFGATGFQRSPTMDEQVKIDSAQERGNIGAFEKPKDVLDFTVQYVGGYFGESKTPEQEEIFDADNEILELFTPGDPVRQYKYFKSKKEYEKALSEVEKVIPKLEKADKQFQDKWKNLIEGDQFIGSEKQYEDYSKDYNKLSSQFDYYTNTPEYQKVIRDSEGSKTIYQKIKDSNLSPTSKKVITGVSKGAEFIPFVSAPLRVLYGAESIATGGEALVQEDLTTKEKLKAGLDIGIGLALTRSGFKGGGSILGKAGKGESILGRVAKFEEKLGISMAGRKGGLARAGLEFAESKGGRAISNLGLTGGIAGASGYDIYQQTGDLGLAVAGGAGAFAGVGLPIGIQSLRGGTKLTTIERRKLTENINKLENSRLNFKEYIYEGSGTRPNSDRIILKGNQKFGNFNREIEIRGDLVKGKKGYTFFAEGEGIAQTTGKIKTKGQTEKGIVDVQSFKAEQLSKGINLGELKGYSIGKTTGSISAYVPENQATKIFKIPKGKGIILKGKEQLERVRQALAKKQVKKGGEGIIEIDTTGRNILLEKQMQEPISSKSVKQFDITPESMNLGRVKGKRPVKSTGYIVDEGALGEFIKFGKIPKTNKISKPKGEIKRTPLSETFKETPPPKSTTKKTPSQKQVQKESNELSNALRNSDLTPTLKTAKKGLKGKTQEAVQKVKGFQTEIPNSVLGGIERTRQREIQKEKSKEKQIQKPLQKAELDTSQVNIQKEIQKTIQAQKNLQKAIMKPVEIQKELIKTIKPKIRVPTRPRPPRRKIPFWLRRKKRRIVQKPEQAPSYDVYVKPPKKKKYLKVTKKPVGLQDAKDTRNYLLDQTTSRQGFIKPRKSKPSKSDYEIPIGYGERTKNKFRTFKQKKGKKIPLEQRRVIEKSKYAIDTRGEKKQLDIFKLMAQAEKRKKRTKKNLPVGFNLA